MFTLKNNKLRFEMGVEMNKGRVKYIIEEGGANGTYYNIFFGIIQKKSKNFKVEQQQ
jgi:hypothetical protein